MRLLVDGLKGSGPCPDGSGVGDESNGQHDVHNRVGHDASRVGNDLPGKRDRFEASLRRLENRPLREAATLSRAGAMSPAALATTKPPWNPGVASTAAQ